LFRKQIAFRKSCALHITLSVDYIIVEYEYMHKGIFIKRNINETYTRKQFRSAEFFCAI
jgi:hypothetical protein